MSGRDKVGDIVFPLNNLVLSFGSHPRMHLRHCFVWANGKLTYFQ